VNAIQSKKSRTKFYWTPNELTWLGTYEILLCQADKSGTLRKRSDVNVNFNLNHLLINQNRNKKNTFNILALQKKHTKKITIINIALLQSPAEYIVQGG